MRKKMFVGLVVFLAVCSYLSSAQAENLIINGSFDEISEKTGLPVGWYFSPRARSDAGKIDDTTAVDGKYSVKITVPPDALEKYLFHQHRPKLKIAIPAGTPIKLSGYSKVKDYVKGKWQEGKYPKHAIALAIQLADGSRKYPAINFSSSEEWEYKEKIYTFDKEIVGINYIYLCDYYSSETVWYDDIYFGHVEGSEDDKHPLVRIPKTNSAPVLDGNLDDTCWQEAAVLSGFVLMGGKDLPANKTIAYLTYDDKNLYLAIRCYEKVLDPIYQRQHKFKANVKERDGRVFTDDCVEIFISSSQKQGYFKLDFNSLATQSDSFKKDKNWNCKWKVAASVGKDSWIGEAIIPLSEIDLKPEMGNRFRFNICREEKALGENSAWSPVKTGFHEPDNFGTGILCSKAIQIIPQEFPKTVFGLGKQSLCFQIKNPQTSSLNLKLNANVYQKENGLIFSQLCNITPQSTQINKLPIILKQPGAYKISFSLLDKERGMLLYRSPEYAISSDVVLKASCSFKFPGEIEFRVNETPVLGKEFYLRKGINILSLRCKKKEMSDSGVAGMINISQGEKIKIDNCWKVSAITESDWSDRQKSDFDDRKWDYAIIQKDGSIWAPDPSARNILLRRIVLIEHTKLKANVGEGLYFAKGTAQHLPLFVASPMNYPMKNLSFTIQTPSDIKIVDSSGRKIYPTIGQLKSIEKGKTIKEKKSFNSYTFHFKNTKPSNKKETPLGVPCIKSTHLFGLVLNLPKDSSLNKSDIYFRFHGEGENRNITEVWNRMPVYCLPPLLDKRPKKLEIQLWHSFRVGTYSETEIQELLKTWHQSGFNSYMERAHRWSKLLSESKFDIVSEYPFQHRTRRLAGKYPEMKSISFDGKKCKTLPISPAFLIDQGREEFQNLIIEYMKKTKPIGLCWDLERNPFNGDVSSSSLKKFAEFAHLNNVPTEKEIKEKYRDEWIDFQSWIMAEVVKAAQEAVKAANPKAKMYIYSAYQSKRNKDHYSIDWNYMKNGIDVAMAGYGRSPHTQETLKALSDVPFIGGISYWKLSRDRERWKSLKTNLLRMITDGAKGVMLFQWSILEGRAYEKISEACAILANFEEFFLKSKKIDTFQVKGGICRDDVVVLSKGKERLLLVFNERSKSKTGTVLNQGLAEDIVTVEYGSDKIYKKQEPLGITIPPNDVKVYLFTDKTKMHKKFKN
ncbi:MAG: sugar-binding protein [bacterium]